MLVLRDRVLAIGDDVVTTSPVFHCSTNGGRTWSYACAR